MKPVLRRARSHSGSGGRGLPAKYCLQRAPSMSSSGAIWRKSDASTNGVRTSIERAIDAQSVSRSN